MATKKRTSKQTRASRRVYYRDARGRFISESEYKRRRKRGRPVKRTVVEKGASPKKTAKKVAKKTRVKKAPKKAPKKKAPKKKAPKKAPKKKAPKKKAPKKKAPKKKVVRPPKRAAKRPPKKRPPPPPTLPKKVQKEQDIAADQQRYRIQQAIQRLDREYEGVTTTYRVKKNADGSVDGELRIFGVPEGSDLNEFMIDLERMITVPQGHWFNVRVAGFFLTESYAEKRGVDLQKLRDLYKRFQGMDVVASYPRSPGKRAVKAVTWQTIRGIVEKMQENYGAENFEGVIARFQWLPYATKPKI